MLPKLIFCSPCSLAFYPLAPVSLYFLPPISRLPKTLRRAHKSILWRFNWSRLDNGEVKGRKNPHQLTRKIRNLSSLAKLKISFFFFFLNLEFYSVSKFFTLPCPKTKFPWSTLVVPCHHVGSSENIEEHIWNEIAGKVILPLWVMKNGWDLYNWCHIPFIPKCVAK